MAININALVGEVAKQNAGQRNASLLKSYDDHLAAIKAGPGYSAGGSGRYAPARPRGGRPVNSNIYDYGENAGTILATPTGMKKNTFREDLAESTSRLNRSGGYGGGSGGGYSPYPTVSMPTLDPIDAPTLTAPTLPTYTAPERDQGRLEFLQRKATAPMVSSLRGGLQSGITSTRSIDNPNARKHALRGMFEGFSRGLGDVTRSGDVAGLGEYNQEFAADVDEARTIYGRDTQQSINEAATANQNLMAQYQQQLADRNALFGIRSNVFMNQPRRNQANAVYGGANRSAGSANPNPYRRMVA